MKKASPLFILAALCCLGILVSWGLFTRHEIGTLKNRILAEELDRSEKDALILDQLGDTQEDLFRQIGIINDEISNMTSRLDPENRLPKDYVRGVRAYITDQMEVFLGQSPIFGTAWEILSIRFQTSDLVSVACRDGEINAILLIQIYPVGKGSYSGEVLYSNVKPWAG